MKILIVGESGFGKSNMADIIRNGIFKADGDSVVKVDDPSRSVKVLGEGHNEYDIMVKPEVGKEDMERADVIIEIKTKAFVEQFRKLN